MNNGELKGKYTFNKEGLMASKVSTQPTLCSQTGLGVRVNKRVEEVLELGGVRKCFRGEDDRFKLFLTSGKPIEERRRERGKREEEQGVLRGEQREVGRSPHSDSRLLL